MFQLSLHVKLKAFHLLILFCVFGFWGSEIAAQMKIAKEGEIKSVRDAGFDYDNVTYSSGNTEIDDRVKAIVDFINKDEVMGMFAITIKFAFIDDSSITDSSYGGNGFHYLSRNANKLPMGTVYLTKRAVTRAMATNKDLIYTLVLHQCAHVWNRWVLIRNGNDEDDKEMLEKSPPSVVETSCEGWAATFTKRFLSGKYSAAELSGVMTKIANDYCDGLSYLVFDKTVISDTERKKVFLAAMNPQPPPPWPGRPQNVRPH